MKPCLPPVLEDLVGAFPSSAQQKQRRLKLVRLAMLRVAPHLASGAAADVRPQDLRTLFLALDLFVFGARYRTAFEMAPPVDFAWCLDGGEEGPDCRLEYFAAGDTSDGHEASTILAQFPTLETPDCEDAATWLDLISPCETNCVDDDSILLELFVAPARVIPPDATEGPCALLDGLADAMLRLMLQAAALVVEEDTGSGLALASGLLKRLRLEDPRDGA